MKKINVTQVIIETIVVLYLILFIYAAFAKLFKFEDFAHQIRVSPILKPIAYFQYVIAVGVPGVEILAAILLIFPATRLKGFWLSGIIMTLFTVYIILILTVASFIPCSCGGVLQRMTLTQPLIFNIGFILLAALAIYLTKRRPKTIEKTSAPSLAS